MLPQSLILAPSIATRLIVVLSLTLGSEAAYLCCFLASLRRQERARGPAEDGGARLLQRSQHGQPSSQRAQGGIAVSVASASRPEGAGEL
jgi:hypothetical protein